MRGVELVDVDIDGLIANLTINGVDLGPPLINTELDRRYPDRATMRPDHAGRLPGRVVAGRPRLPTKSTTNSANGLRR